MFFDNYYNDAQGKKDGIWTAKYDLSTLQNPVLSFDVAYAKYDNNYSDTLEIGYSTDCGATFTQLYLKGGDILSTAPSITSGRFEPTNTQWRSDLINLDIVNPLNDVIISFTNRGHYGQPIYLDNINIQSTTNVKMEQLFNAPKIVMAPNPASNQFTIAIEGGTKNDVWNLQITDHLGKVVLQNKNMNSNQNNVIDITALSAGVYMVEVMNSGTVLNKKLVVK
jgi:hypothetical protein